MTIKWWLTLTLQAWFWFNGEWLLKADLTWKYLWSSVYVETCLWCVGRERWNPTDEFIEDDTKRPPIHFRPMPSTQKKFRGQIIWSPNHSFSFFFARHHSFTALSSYIFWRMVKHHLSMWVQQISHTQKHHIGLGLYTFKHSWNLGSTYTAFTELSDARHTSCQECLFLYQEFCNVDH